MSVKIQPIQESIQEYFQKNNPSAILVLCDQNTKKYCYPSIKEHLPPHKLLINKAGEKYKNLATAEKIWNFLTKYEADRHALVLNMGGGVLGDMGGFCAATYKRGIPFIQIPTTLLSQVDASVGGKLAIDFQSFKNHIGVFSLPEEVWIDSVFLQTLPLQELRSGFAEIIKHCLIYDKNHWKKLSQQTSLQKLDFNYWIQHSVKIKEEITTTDPKEKGVRKILNFGHTIGHAIETHFLNTKKPLLHGEAIAIGMICESFLSQKTQNILESELSQISSYILSIFGKSLIKTSDFSILLKIMLQDKKNKNGKILFSLLGEVGRAVYDIEISKSHIINSLHFYNSL